MDAVLLRMIWHKIAMCSQCSAGLYSSGVGVDKTEGLAFTDTAENG